MYVFFVSVCVDAFLHFSKTCCVNINELIWKRDIFASEIGKEVKCGYGSMWNCSVQFSKDVGSSIVS
jgi:hypothetical protein